MIDRLIVEETRRSKICRAIREVAFWLIRTVVGLSYNVEEPLCQPSMHLVFF